MAPKLTMKEACAAVRLHRTTVLRALQEGRISGEIANGKWSVDAESLYRAYPPGGPRGLQPTTPTSPGNSPLMQWIVDVALPNQGDDCLTWPFTRIRTGYGRIGRGGKNHYAHRYICQLVHGEPPEPNYHAAHSCGNGHLACVNPRHLSWKTSSENQLEGRKHCRRVLTPQQVAEIRRLRGIARTDHLAERFGVTEPTIRKIYAGLTHRAYGT